MFPAPKVATRETQGFEKRPFTEAVQPTPRPGIVRGNTNGKNAKLTMLMVWSLN